MKTVRTGTPTLKNLIEFFFFLYLNITFYKLILTEKIGVLLDKKNCHRNDNLKKKKNVKRIK